MHKDDETRREALRRALSGGINWIDTAAQYGNGKSEDAIGRLLPEMNANPYLSTKFGLDVSNLDDIPRRIEESLTASLARLKRDPWDGFFTVRQSITDEMMKQVGYVPEPVSAQAVKPKSSRWRKK